MSPTPYDFGFGAPLASGFLGPAPAPPPAAMAPPAAAPPPPLAGATFIPRAQQFWATGSQGPDFEPTPLPPPGGLPLSGPAASPPAAPAQPSSGLPQRQLSPVLGAPSMGFGASVSGRGAPGPAGVDPSKVVTGGGGGGAAGGPGGASADPLAGLNADERGLYNLQQLQIQDALKRVGRGGGGSPVKIVKQQTGETLQGVVGPDADKLAAWRKARGQGAEIDKNLATFDRDLAFRRTDNAGDLLAEQQRGQARLEQIEAARGEALGQIRTQIDGVRQKVAAGEIDPDRLWHKAGNAERGGFLVASFLSGVGSALSSKGGGGNSAIDSLFKLMDRDNANQETRLRHDRQKLSDLQQLHDWTAKNFESDRAGQAASNIARLEGLKQQFEVEYQQMAAKMPVYAGRDAQGNVIEKTPLDLRMDQARSAIDQRIAAEEMKLSQELNGTFSKTFGFAKTGGGGGGMTLAQIIALKKAQVGDIRAAQKAGADIAGDQAKAAAQGRIVSYGGQTYQVDPRFSSSVVDEAQKRLLMTGKGLSAVDALEARAGTGGGMVGGLATGARLIGWDRLANTLADPAQSLGANELAAILAQASGAGVPSDHQIRLAEAATAPGPRQAAALGEIRRELRDSNARDLQALGVGR